MRFTTLVMLPDKVDDVISYVDSMMSPFDLNKIMPPQKEYVDEITIKNVMQKYYILNNDLQLIAEKLEEWSGDKCEIDENGLYCFTTINLFGRWDSWILHDVKTDVQYIEQISENLGVMAIISLNGEWYDITSLCWKQELSQIFYDRSISCIYVAILDCHS